MIPEAFVAKWKGVTLKERSAAQEHFIDLRRLLELPTPADADPMPWLAECSDAEVEAMIAGGSIPARFARFISGFWTNA